MTDTVWVKIERPGGHVETRAVEGSPEEIEEQVNRWATLFGLVHVLDRSGSVVRTVTAGDAGATEGENR